MVKFFVFRHGETDWNLEWRFQGHTDIPLNEQGRLQAHALSKKLKLLNLEIILSSDLSRATETSEIIAKEILIPIMKSSDLREARLGDPEGMIRDDIIAKYGTDRWNRWTSVKEEDLDFGYPNGETKQIQLTRIKNHLQNHVSHNPTNTRIGVSTHGGVLRRLIHFCEGAPSEPVPMHNCVLYELHYSLADKRWLYMGPV